MKTPGTSNDLYGVLDLFKKCPSGPRRNLDPMNDSMTEGLDLPHSPESGPPPSCTEYLSSHCARHTLSKYPIRPAPFSFLVPLLSFFNSSLSSSSTLSFFQPFLLHSHLSPIPPSFLALLLHPSSLRPPRLLPRLPSSPVSWASSHAVRCRSPPSRPDRLDNPDKFTV